MWLAYNLYFVLRILCGLICTEQVHTFYEALGCMISAQTDTQMQERLIEKYMALPNQVWDNIILQATHVSKFMYLIWLFEVLDIP